MSVALICPHHDCAGCIQARRAAKKNNKLLFKEETKRQVKATQHGVQAAGQTVLFM